MQIAKADFIRLRGLCAGFRIQCVGSPVALFRPMSQGRLGDRVAPRAVGCALFPWFCYGEFFGFVASRLCVIINDMECGQSSQTMAKAFLKIKVI